MFAWDILADTIFKATKVSTGKGISSWSVVSINLFPCSLAVERSEHMYTIPVEGRVLFVEVECGTSSAIGNHAPSTSCSCSKQIHL